MLTLETLISFLFQRSSFLMLHQMLVISILLSLAGCTGEGASGPIISSLSSPTDVTEGLDSDQAAHSEDVNHNDGEEDPIITMTSTATGVTAQVTWERPSDINVAGYAVYYGKRSEETPSPEESSSEESGAKEPTACSRGESQAVENPPATITGLEPNTPYFFAIRAFNESESESLCSNEIIVVTPPAQS